MNTHGGILGKTISEFKHCETSFQAHCTMTMWNVNGHYATALLGTLSSVVKKEVTAQWLKLAMGPIQYWYRAPIQRSFTYRILEGQG